MTLGELIDNRDIVVLSTGRTDPFFHAVAQRIVELYGAERVIIAQEGASGRLRIARHKHDDAEMEPKFVFAPEYQHNPGDALAGRKVLVVSTQGMNPSFMDDFDFLALYERTADSVRSEDRGLVMRLLRHGFVRSVPEASDAKIAWIDAARENGADEIHIIEPYSFRQSSDRGPVSRENRRIQERGDIERAKLDGQSPGLVLEARLEADACIASKVVYHSHSPEDMTYAYRRAGVRLVQLDPAPIMASIIRSREERALVDGQPRKAVFYVPDLGAVPLGKEIFHSLGLDYFSFIVVQDKIKKGPHAVEVVFGDRSTNYDGCEGARVYCCDDQIRSAATMRVGLGALVQTEGVPLFYAAIASHGDLRSATTQRNLAAYDVDGAHVPIEVYTTLSKPQVIHVCGKLQDTTTLVNTGRLLGDAAARCLLHGQRLDGLYTRDAIDAERLYTLTPARQMYDAFIASLRR